MRRTNKTRQELEVFVKKLLSFLGDDKPRVKIDWEGGQVKIEIETKNAPVLIGRHGRTVEALRRIVSLFLFKKGFNGHVFLDVNRYYQDQDEELIERVKSIISQVIEGGQEMRVPNLTARQRRIVHLYCAGIGGAESLSMDTQNGRVLIIRPIN